MTRVALVGGSGGIGSALLSSLSDQPFVSHISSTYYRSPAAGSLGSIGNFGSSVPISWAQLDVTDEASVAAWAASLGELDWLINCAGFLHDTQFSPEKSLAQCSAEQLEKNMRVNCLPNLLLAKHTSSALKSSAAGVFASITAKVGSIADNRLGGWHSYRASKAAANMVLKNIAIEWNRTLPNVRVLALHPGTTDTNLSAPFQQGVQPGKLFSTEKTAGLLIARLQEAHDGPSGRFIAYDGEELPW